MKAAYFNSDLNAWNVSLLLFCSHSTDNDDLSAWNVGQVTDITTFNGNLSTWNVGQVTDITTFNGDLSAWNVPPYEGGVETEVEAEAESETDAELSPLSALSAWELQRIRAEVVAEEQAQAQGERVRNDEAWRWTGVCFGAEETAVARAEENRMWLDRYGRDTWTPDTSDIEFAADVERRRKEQIEREERDEEIREELREEMQEEPHSRIFAWRGDTSSSDEEAEEEEDNNLGLDRLGPTASKVGGVAVAWQLGDQRRPERVERATYSLHLYT